MNEPEKAERFKEIKELIQRFCDEHLNEELAGYAMNLFDKLSRKRNLSMTRGRKEIWAASIVYTIARFNFLFDPENENFLTADTICDFFGTKKSTIGNKATQIEKECHLRMGEEGLCSPEISDMFTIVQLPNGFIIPKSMLPELKFDYEIEFVEGEEAEELERLIEEKKRLEEQKAEEKKARRAEINRKIAEDKKKKKQEDKRQLSFFDKS